VEHFKLGEAVAPNRLSTGTRGTVVSVTEDGLFVTVRWSIPFLQEGRSTPHCPDDRVRVTGRA
jgi:hypothetical protein